MYGKLREWETDTYLIEGRVDILVNIEIHAPIVGTVYPNTYYHVYAAVRQGCQGDKRSGRLGQDAGILRQYRLYHLLYFLIIAAVFHAKSPVYTASRLVTEISHNATAQRAVRYINDLIINTAGACLGYWIYYLLSKALPNNFRKKLQSENVNGTVEVLLFVIYIYMVMVTVQPWVIHDVLNIG